MNMCLFLSCTWRIILNRLKWSSMKQLIKNSQVFSVPLKSITPICHSVPSNRLRVTLNRPQSAQKREKLYSNI